jgi:hypothetical protein
MRIETEKIVNALKLSGELTEAGYPPKAIEVYEDKSVIELWQDYNLMQAEVVEVEQEPPIDHVVVINGIIEAHDPTPLPVPLSQEERIAQLEAEKVELEKRLSDSEIANLNLMLATAEAIEKQVQDKIELQLAMAEMLELILGGSEE